VTIDEPTPSEPGEPDEADDAMILTTSDDPMILMGARWA
jgi:hypothetical protein